MCRYSGHVSTTRIVEIILLETAVTNIMLPLLLCHGFSHIFRVIMYYLTNTGTGTEVREAG